MQYTPLSLLHPYCALSVPSNSGWNSSSAVSARGLGLFRGDWVVGALSLLTDHAAVGVASYTPVPAPCPSDDASGSPCQTFPMHQQPGMFCYGGRVNRHLLTQAPNTLRGGCPGLQELSIFPTFPYLCREDQTLKGSPQGHLHQ